MYTDVCKTKCVVFYGIQQSMVQHQFSIVSYCTVSYYTVQYSSVSNAKIMTLIQYSPEYLYQRSHFQFPSLWPMEVMEMKLILQKIKLLPAVQHARDLQDFSTRPSCLYFVPEARYACYLTCLLHLRQQVKSSGVPQQSFWSLTHSFLIRRAEEEQRPNTLFPVHK